MERLIRRRRETPELGWGTWKVLRTNVSSVLAHRCDWEGRTVVAVHNLGDAEATTTIAGDGLDADGLEEVLGRGEHRPRAGGGLEVGLPRYGYRWLRSP